MSGIVKVEMEKKNSNDLLGRVDGSARVYFKDATPTRVEMRKKIAESLSVDPETLMITHTQNEFGKHNVVCTLHIYKSVDELKKKEPEYLQKRFGLIEGEKKEKKGKTNKK